MGMVQQTVDRRSLFHTDLCKKAYNDTYVCQGEWLQCAAQILCRNGIEHSIFADALAIGDGTGHNIYIMCPVNCGKTFILDSLRVSYNTFLSSVISSYARLGVDDNMVICLNDFWYTPANVPWNDMLLLLEGHVIHFAVPKTTYAGDIEFFGDTLVFAMSNSPIVFITGSSIEERETEMMDVRWRNYHFSIRFPCLLKRQ